mmetsp:Transcript_21005/g.25221  ORF Transcript_21005/g.25221 Transcript_21005/m.25221 type:complete len:87 (+) Transcript_21005:2-262(+)
MSHNQDGLYSARFRVPDTHGVYKISVTHKRRGMTSVYMEETVPVRPLKHDEHPRFIPQAYPHYVSVFSMMAGFFVFGLVFLYHQPE